MRRSGGQLEFVFRGRGGARPGAGRRPHGARAGVAHLRRAEVSRNHPLHVTLRAVRGLSVLRSGLVFPRVRAALAAGKARFGFRLVHFSVQGNHVHLIAEADGQVALARGVAGLSIRIARAVNRALQRTGRLFADRYHFRALRSPREVRFALRYVLLNARKHAAQSRSAGGGREEAVAPGFVDPCSSAAWLECFARPAELVFGARAVCAEWAREGWGTGPPVSPARTWLLRVGLRRAGPFDIDEVPSGAG